jgi:hypothetical protein
MPLIYLPSCHYELPRTLASAVITDFSLWRGWFRRQDSSCGIYGGQSGSETHDFVLEPLRSAVSIIPLRLHTHSSVIGAIYYHQLTVSLNKTLHSSHYAWDSPDSRDGLVPVLASGCWRWLSLCGLVPYDSLLLGSLHYLFNNTSRRVAVRTPPPPTSIIQHVQSRRDVSIPPTPRLAASRHILTAAGSPNTVYTRSAISVPQLLHVDRASQTSICLWA